jgi:flavin reductase (DIM6/NTAB) family NADH-FMN oxidoreductase RutF
MSWRSHFGFVCTPRHNTYHNVLREKQFAVTYVRPDQAVLASLAATPRCDDGSKPVASALSTLPGEQVPAPLLQGGYLFIECELAQIVDGLDENSLIIGRIVAARVSADALRISEEDDQQLVHDAPLLAYLYPGRFAEISDSMQMPFPAGFRR